MYTTPEQFLNATKASLETQFAAINAFNQSAFESMEKLVALNMNVAKASLEESTQAVNQILGAKDAQELVNLTQAQAKPSFDKLVDYGRQLASISTATQQELTKAVEAHVAQTNAKVLVLIDELSKNAPAGSEAAVTAVKTVIGNINAGYDQLNKASKQAISTLEDTLNNATKQFTQAAEVAVEKATAKAKK